METTTTTTAARRPAMRTDAQRPRMTRYEARMIAEELHRLMKRDGQQEEVPEELLTTKEAAAFLRRSYSFMQHNGSAIPRRRVGREWLYTKKDLLDALHTLGRADS